LVTPAVLSIALAGCAEEDPLDISGPRSCEQQDQNEWVYWLMQNYYLWNDEVPELDPGPYETSSDLVKDLRGELDRWSRVSEKSTSDAFFKEGKFLGLGYKTSRNEDGELLITFIHGGSPAEEAGMKRGDRLDGLNGFSVAELDELSAWGDVTGPNEPGVPVKIEFSTPGIEGSEEAILVKSWIDIVTVPDVRVFDTSAGKIGYVNFMTFVQPSFGELDAAFDEFQADGIRSVVVDMRYNGGGLLSVAKHLASLLVGSENEGLVAYAVEYNELLETENRVYRLDELDNSLELEHVVFITTGRTLSASELVINMLRPYVEVHIIGEETGGKPVGSHSYDFCEQVIFPISFRLVNSTGNADYFEGLAPDCLAEDDLQHELGDPSEKSLFTALHVIAEGECPTKTSDDPSGTKAYDPSEGEGLRRLIGSW
jgi:C-terminal processing protease CtpA/Prc